MQIKVSTKQSKSDLLVLPLYKTKKLPPQIKKHLTASHKDQAENAFSRKMFDAELGKTLTLHSPKSSKALYKSITLLGLGEKKKLNLHKVKKAGSALDGTTKAAKAKTITIVEDGHGLWLATALLLKAYRFDKHLSEKKKDKIKTVTVITKKKQKEATELTTFIESIYYTRDLINSTSNEIGPAAMVREAKAIAKAKNIKITILDRKKLQSIKMGAIMSVGK